MPGRRTRAKRLPAGTICYLCGQAIDPYGDWNRDHHPPKRFFGRAVRQGANLKTLFTHNACNTAYKHDEEYFIAAIPIQAIGTWTADAVLKDFGEGVREGRWRSVYDRVRSQFGRVHTPSGQIPFLAEFHRLNRVVWKLARGSYFSETGRVLPEGTLRTIELVLPQEAESKLPGHEWFPIVRDTPSLSHVAAVFDLKMVRQASPEMAIGLMAMLFWDKVIALVGFHDVGCPCNRCLEQSNGDS